MACLVRRSIVLGSFAGVFLVSLGLELFLVYVVHRFTFLSAGFWHIFPPLVDELSFAFFGVSCFLNIPSPCSTNNNLAAGVVASQLSDASVVVASTASGSTLSSLSADSIAEAVVRAIGSSLPTILSSIQVNAHRHQIPPLRQWR